MDGPWLFRLDPANVGVRQGLQRETSAAGWTPVTVPNAWNATDESLRVVPGHGRLVPQGLQAAQRRAAPVLDRALRVGQLPLAHLAQRPADRRQPRRLPALRGAPARLAAQARRAPTASSSASTTAASAPTSRRRAFGERQADRRLVELRRPAARGLPAQGRRRRLQHRPAPPRPALRDVRGDGDRSASRCATTLGRRRARRG